MSRCNIPLISCAHSNINDHDSFKAKVTLDLAVFTLSPGGRRQAGFVPGAGCPVVLAFLAVDGGGCLAGEHNTGHAHGLLALPIAVAGHSTQPAPPQLVLPAPPPAPRAVCAPARLAMAAARQETQTAPQGLYNLATAHSSSLLTHILH